MLVLWIAVFAQVCASQDIFLSRSWQDDPSSHAIAIYGAPSSCITAGGEGCTSTILKHGYSSVKIGLRRSTAAKQWLKDTVMAISDPLSKRYGEIVDRSAVQVNSGASADNIQGVEAWLDAQKLHREWMTGGDWVTASGHPESLTRLFPLPSHIVPAIDHIHFSPSLNSGLDKQHRRPRENNQEEIKVTPETIWRYLDIDVKHFENDKTAAAISVASPYDEGLGQDNVMTFISEYGVGDASGIDWSKGCGEGLSEPNLDMEMAMATAPNATHKFYCGPPKHSTQFCEGVLDYLTWAYGEESAPKVHTFSYTVNSLFGIPQACREKIDEELQKLGTQRISTFWASGDSGSGKSDTFPAASPWGTAVGGVVLADASANASVAAWSGSGGGFDPKEERLSYQNASVTDYISVAKPRKPTSGRGYPDLAAFSTHVCTDKGCGSTGTSAATPIVAAAFGLLNGARAAAGKSPLGFVNPLLYQHPEAFRDVTEGRGNGYPVAQGWDPVTGLGIPQISKLLQIVMRLP